MASRLTDIADLVEESNEQKSPELASAEQVDDNEEEAFYRSSQEQIAHNGIESSPRVCDLSHTNIEGESMDSIPLEKEAKDVSQTSNSARIDFPWVQTIEATENQCEENPGQFQHSETPSRPSESLKTGQNIPAHPEISDMSSIKPLPLSEQNMSQEKPETSLLSEQNTERLSQIEGPSNDLQEFDSVSLTSFNNESSEQTKAETHVDQIFAFKAAQPDKGSENCEPKEQSNPEQKFSQPLESLAKIPQNGAVVDEREGKDSCNNSGLMLQSDLGSPIPEEEPIKQSTDKLSKEQSAFVDNTLRMSFATEQLLGSLTVPTGSGQLSEILEESEIPSRKAFDHSLEGLSTSEGQSAKDAREERNTKDNEILNVSNDSQQKIVLDKVSGSGSQTSSPEREKKKSPSPNRKIGAKVMGPPQIVKSGGDKAQRKISTTNPQSTSSGVRETKPRPLGSRLPKPGTVSNSTSLESSRY